MKLERLLSAALFGLACALGAASCFTGSDGLVPPTEQLYFPTGVVVSPGRTALYVVNSDFDLQYNGGTVQALNLTADGDHAGVRATAEKVAAAIADGQSPEDVCATIGSKPTSSATLYPGPCDAIDVEPFIRAFATIGAFGGGASLLLREDGEPGARLFVGVRGDPSLTYFDVADDRAASPQDTSGIVSPCDGPYCLECGGTGDEQRCARTHRIGENIFTSQRGLLLPTEPTSLATAPARVGDPIVAAHQTTATASLTVNNWPSKGNDTPLETTPSLEFLLENLPEAPTFVAAMPPPAFVSASGVEYRPGFVLTHRAAATLSVVRYFDDAGAAPPRPFLTHTDDVSITISSDNADSRGVAFDTSARDACERELCGPDEIECLKTCLDTKVGFYIASRSPSALLVGTLETTPEPSDSPADEVTSIDEKISIDESVPLPIGPAVVAVGKVIGSTGELETRVFVVCFDSRFVAVYDPVLRRIETMIRTGRGPFGLAFDTGLDEDGVLRSYMVLSQFTDSYLSIVDLDTRRITYATSLVNLGPPVSPREEQ